MHIYNYASLTLSIWIIEANINEWPCIQSKELMLGFQAMRNPLLGLLLNKGLLIFIYEYINERISSGETRLSKLRKRPLYLFRMG